MTLSAYPVTVAPSRSRAWNGYCSRSGRASFPAFRGQEEGSVIARQHRCASSPKESWALWLAWEGTFRRADERFATLSSSYSCSAPAGVFFASSLLLSSWLADRLLDLQYGRASYISGGLLRPFIHSISLALCYALAVSEHLLAEFLTLELVPACTLLGTTSCRAF